MKLKYYMRGVGTGILLSVFVFVVIIIPNREIKDDVNTEKNGEMENTDKEGLSEVLWNTPSALVLPDNGDSSGMATPKPTATEAPTPKPTATETPTPEPTATETPTPEPTATEAPKLSPTATDNNEGESEDYVKIVIHNGMTSEQFSMKVKEAGLLETWSELNNYLIKNNYAERIKVGTYKIKKGSTISEIVKKVTGR